MENKSECFISEIELKNVKYINSFKIPLSTTERKHLILTGKNGSGKTTTLNEINLLLSKLHNNQFTTLEAYKKNIKQYEDNIRRYEMSMVSLKDSLNTIHTHLDNPNTSSHQRQQLEQQTINIQQQLDDIPKHIEEFKQRIKESEKNIEEFANVNILFTNQQYLYEHVNNGDFIMAYFQAKRENMPKIPTNIQKIDLPKKYSTDTRTLHNSFIQYIVGLRMQMLDAKEEGEVEVVKRIKDWFKEFENALINLYEKKDLKLKYDRDALNYKIEYDNRSFGLNELSDGYSAVLSIITELILRMEAHQVKSYDLQGVVLIDEIETHLHVSLQKKILPFLTTFFPKIQFILTTHSPFVLSSLEDVIICDLEKKSITENLYGYSYESLVDSYFDTDKYSDFIKKKLLKYEELSLKERNALDEDERLELLEMKIFFSKIPSFQNEELHIEISRINRINNKNTKE